MTKLQIEKKGHSQKKKSLLSAFSIFILTALCLLLTQAASVEADVQAVGRFTHTEGVVDILHGGELPAVAAKIGDPVNVKDIVRTKSASKAEIVFADGNILRIAQKSRIDISEYKADGSATNVIKMPRGKVEAVVEKK